MGLNNIAWSMLTEDERAALTLQLGMGKSSWQSGEIMKRSHYKYLEIKYRAEHFLKAFTEHIKLFDCIIPEGINGNKRVIEYLKICIEERKKPMVALQRMNKIKRITKVQLNERIIKQLEEWEESDNAYDVTTFHFVKDFDRWNNFRILPKVIQEPSAFKRRIKNTYKKQIRITANLPTISLDKLIKNYQTKNQGGWVPVLYNRKAQVYKMKINNQSYKIFSNIGLYIFHHKADASEYIEAIEEYVGKGKKACTDGLDFWPIYREVIKKALNYQEIQKITPSRRFLATALSKLEFI
jgi:hypothetical protein